MHSPSLLKWISLTQESNWSLLHCRRVLYQLSYQGSQFLYSSRDILKDDNFASAVEVEFPTGKTTALTRWTFVGKLMSLLFNMLFVIALLPKSKCLNFMAAVIVHSDF